ncbi:type VI secretion system baseplate subunit TssF [Enterobacteriaceae bacterium ESL0689]|nr:type VI secretion system baseplate subunit TssF [Enterobacteriaceae bacterium ESL0689]
MLLDKSDEQLERIIDASHLALHCTPVINLFPKMGAARSSMKGSTNITWWWITSGHWIMKFTR